jgi:hypothetical protein
VIEPKGLYQAKVEKANRPPVVQATLSIVKMRQLRWRIADANRLRDLRLLAGEAAAASAMDRGFTRLTFE